MIVFFILSFVTWLASEQTLTQNLPIKTSIDFSLYLGTQKLALLIQRVEKKDDFKESFFLI